MPFLQQAISHSLLMTWLAFVGTAPRWNQSHWSLTEIFRTSSPGKAHYLGAELAVTAALEALLHCHSEILQVLKQL